MPINMMIQAGPKHVMKTLPKRQTNKKGDRAMRNVPYVKLFQQVPPIRVSFFIIAFFMMISPIYGSEKKSWEERSLECIEGNCLNGKGTMIYYSSQKYIGEFKDGKRHGQGVLNLPLGRVLKGTWRNDEIVMGTATFSDGTRYTGSWEFGYRQGKGELLYPDGRKYIGEFHAGNKHGQGTMIYPDGRVYTGEYKKGKRTGHGIMTYPDGRKITGQFFDSKYVGPGQK
jgi:hypothetical protein